MTSSPDRPFVHVTDDDVTTPDPPALLDALDEAHAKATPGLWESSGWNVEVERADGAHSILAECFGEHDAAAIVAAHNALPALTAAARAVLALHVLENAEDGTDCIVCGWESGFPCPTVREVTAALTGGQA